MGIFPTDAAKQRMILIGIVPILGLCAYMYYPHAAAKERIATLDAHLEQLASANRTAKVLAARGGPQLEAKLKLYEQHMIRLEQLIPKSEEVPELLNAMAQQAQATDVELAGIKPEAGVAGNFYTRQVYDISVYGSYHNVGRFLTAVGSLPRIVTPIELKLQPRKELDRSGAVRLQADFKVETYITPDPGTAKPVQDASTHART